MPCYKRKLIRPSIDIVNLANLKIMFCWRNQIYHKCNKFNASNIDDFQWLQLLHMYMQLNLKDNFQSTVQLSYILSSLKSC